MDLDSFNVISSVLPPDTRLAGFRGSEGISRLYQFDVHTLHLTLCCEDLESPQA